MLIPITAFTIIWIIMSFLTGVVVSATNILCDWNVGWFFCVVSGFVLTILGILLVEILGNEDYND